MKSCPGEHQNGSFAKRFMEDQAAGAPEFRNCVQRAGHPIEATGRKLRELFSWNSLTTTTPKVPSLAKQ